MPLRDHFHPPLADLRHWGSFHAAWATEIMRTLNRRVLPPGCFAEAQVHLGGRVEIDVATFDQMARATPEKDNGNTGGVAVQAWAPPATALVMPAIFPDEIEVQVFRMSGGATLVGAIELVSPRNKDRPEARRAFTAKCASYLQQGVGLVVVDVVTDRLANLHDELIRLLEQPADFEFPAEAALYATAYRPRRLESGDQIELWLVPLVLGQPLPIMPLALQGVATVPVDLETTYATTCEDIRL
ncbi:MAG: DUF4058 family protein [Gemmataceae bacterium]|nr:DUF4058 family protein [Gemmataceae bacterium]